VWNSSNSFSVQTILGRRLPNYKNWCANTALNSGTNVQYKYKVGRFTNKIHIAYVNNDLAYLKLK